MRKTRVDKLGRIVIPKKMRDRCIERVKNI